ncbi:multidrug effflux MFS transporter [Litoreibacter roseus]|uniref:Bcr/CflA family efflux transporter n=1 Tax=Litoreibacter roseus TaxID=2601869 RepID=A0A6N6JNC7_9RHOB|nr:multidrug effflux MFS transporter [Litoreibacter roseus]GFE66908.1 MFS transporter [Litoreibacter roseus]
MSNADIAPTAPAKRLPLPEFIALIAMSFAMVAFSIDAMLPALPDIAAEISPENVNNAQLVLTSFVFGLGIGTFFTGPLSDSLGRKPVILGGAALYVAGAILAAQAQTIEVLIASRVLQGLGAAGPRVVAVAIIRDLYEGRQMARIMSYAMMIFTLFPAVAPLIGLGIINLAGWRAIFAAFVLFAAILVVWISLRQPETLPPEARRPFRIKALKAAVIECFRCRIFVLSTATQALSFGMLFGCLSSTQQIFDQVYGRGDSFPLWFAGIALVAGTGSILNARLVLLLGMRLMIMAGFVAQLTFSVGIVALATVIDVPFLPYLIWTTSIFFMAGMVIGNLNALAMEPLGHIAGLAASVIGAVATVLGVCIAVPIGLAFNGTPLPLAFGTLVLSALGVLIIRFGMSRD